VKELVDHGRRLSRRAGVLGGVCPEALVRGMRGALVGGD